MNESSEDENLQKEERIELFADALCDLLKHAINTPIVMARIADFLDPQPIKLANSKEEADTLNRKISRLIRECGGPPELIIIRNDDLKKPVYDTYVKACIEEALAVFRRSRSTIIRAHSLYVGSETIRQHPEWFIQPLTDKETEFFVKYSTDEFWESCETAYIRLASLWDRLGQLLDFVFFNIRQYERDGFPAVMDRIRVNFVPISSAIAENKAWKLLRQYQSSEAETGQKWLLRRRNLLIHSLHLRPVPQNSGEDEIFLSAYNHLDESVREKLRPRTMQAEIEHLHSHLCAAAEGITDTLDLCEEGIKYLQATRCS